MSRTDQYALHLSVDGQDLGIWDKMSGGDLDSSDVKYRTGNMGPQRAFGGPRTVSDITVSRLYDLARDHQLMPFYDSIVGKGDVILSKQPLDEDGNAFGRPIVYTGKCKTINPPDADSDANAVALIAMVISAASMIST